MKYLKIICLLCVFANTAPVFGQIFASAELPPEKKSIAPEKAFASCPNPAGTIVITPSKPEYCKGDVINTKFNTSSPISGNISWSYSGSYTSDAPFGANNSQDKFTGLQSTGQVNATGTVMVGALSCTFSILSPKLIIDPLLADAGPDQTDYPGYSAANIGVTACANNGVPAYSESWSPITYITGPTNACQTTVDGQLTPGFYTLTVSDTYCSATSQMYVTVACPPSGSFGSISVTPGKAIYCKGDNISGSTSFSNPYFNLSGNVNWSYSGTPTLVTPFGTSNINYSLSNLTASGILQAAGTLTLAGGTLTCSFATTLPINVDDLLADAGSDLTYTPGVTGLLTVGNMPCEIGGFPAYTQTWTPSTFVNGGVVSGCQLSVKNLTTTTVYSITVTDNRGCTARDNMTVTVACPSPTSLASITGSPSFVCINANASGTLSTLNSFFSSLSGNVNWSYSGSPGPTSYGTNLSSFSITGLSTPGTVTATGSVVLSGGTLTCPYNIQYTPSVSALSANAGPDIVYVPGTGAVTIGTAVCANNGTPSYSYTWNPSGNIVGSVNNCTASINNLTGNTTYTLSVKDTYCTAVDQMSVTLACPSASSIVSIVQGQAVQCVGGNSTGSLSVLNSAFTLTNNATWGYSGTPAVTSSGTNLRNYAINGLLTAGTLTVGGSVVVTGGTLVCSYTTQVTLSVSALSANAGLDKVYVPGAGAIAIGTAVCANNGNPSYSYTWSPSGNIVGSVNNCTASVNNLSATTVYTLTVKDSYCTATDQMTVTLACPLASSIASIVPNQSVQCINGNSTGSLSILIPAFTTTGNATWGYSGTPSVASSGVNQVNYSIFGLLTAGNLTVSGNVVVSGGTLVCPYTALVNFSPMISNLGAYAGSDQVYTPGGGSITVGVNICGLYGNPGYTYSWTPPTGIVGAATTCTIEVNNLTSTTVYTLTVYDTYCNATDQMTVTLACPSPTSIASLSLSPVQPLYCPGSTVSGTVTSTLFNASTPVTWSYSGSNTVTSSGTNSVNFVISGLQSSGVVTASGTMQITGGTLTCPFTTTTQINESTLVADAGAPQAWSSGGITAVIGGSVCGYGATGTYSASWTPSTGLSSTTICNPTITSIAGNTTYTLTVTDMYCTATNTVTVYFVGGVPNNKYYAILKKELDAGYFNSINTSTANILYFKFDEEYYTPPSTNLSYKIYDDTGTLISSTPSLIETIGDNRFALSVTSLTTGYYRLYVYNQKNETWQSRIKIN